MRGDLKEETDTNKLVVWTLSSLKLLLMCVSSQINNFFKRQQQRNIAKSVWSFSL